MKLKNRTS